MSNEHEALPEGMVPWNGGDAAPEDWDGGAVALADGSVSVGYIPGHLWHRFGDNCIVGYTRATPSPSTDTLERREAIKAAVSRARREWDGSEDVSIEDAITDAILALATTPAPREKLEADLAKAVKALKPFADQAEFYDDCEQHPFGCPGDALAGELPDLTVADFRRARATLSQIEGEG